MKKIYRIICVIFCLVIIFNFPISSTASNMDSINDWPCFNNLNIDINDSFSTESILVVLSHEASLSSKVYTPADFPEVNCLEVVDLTEDMSNLIQKQILAEQTEDWSELQYHIQNSMLVDLSSFRRILSLKIDTSDQTSTNTIQMAALKENAIESVQNLTYRSDLQFVGVDYIHESATTTPNDPRYTSTEQWAIDKIQLTQAWDITTGNTITKVGVIDTGIDQSHPDIASNVNTTLSRSFSDFYSDPLQDSTKEEENNGHGTHVAGIIGAVSNNGVGVVGTCWNVDLISLRINNQNGSWYSSKVIQAISYATSIGVRLLNYSGRARTSSGSTIISDPALEQALVNFPGLFICAAGNNGNDLAITPQYPAAYSLPNIITVSASNSNDDHCTFSNYSEIYSHLYAPGESILSTVVGNRYLLFSGTSMATPYVTGVAALLWSKYPNLSVQEVKNSILNNVDLCAGLSNKCITGGRLNAYKALTNIAHEYQYNSHNDTTHTRICTECGTVSNQMHTYDEYTNLGVTSGHRKHCESCPYSMVEAHTWTRFGQKFKCAQCLVITSNIEIFHPGSLANMPASIRAMLLERQLGNMESVQIDDKLSIMYVNGQYYWVYLLSAEESEAAALQHIQAYQTGQLQYVPNQLE